MLTTLCSCQATLCDVTLAWVLITVTATGKAPNLAQTTLMLVLPWLAMTVSIFICMSNIINKTKYLIHLYYRRVNLRQAGSHVQDVRIRIKKNKSASKVETSHWLVLQTWLLPVFSIRWGDEVVLLQVVLQSGEQSELQSPGCQSSLLLQRRLQRDRLCRPSPTS